MLKRYYVTSIAHSGRKGERGVEKTDRASRQNIGRAVQFDCYALPYRAGNRLGIPFADATDANHFTVLWTSPVVNVEVRTDCKCVTIETENSIYQFEEA